MPAVEAAFVNLHAQRTQVVSSPVGAAPEPASVHAEPMAPMLPLVALAVGVLMHRYSLLRGAALERLQQLAATEGRPLSDQAERLVAAVEELSMPAPDQRRASEK